MRREVYRVQRGGKEAGRDRERNGKREGGRVGRDEGK